MSHRQLTREERYTISALRQAGKSVAEMARILGRHRSTIYRECKRNATVHVLRGLTVYCPSKAQQRRNGRLRRSRRGCHHSSEQYAVIRHLLHQQWSPEQIAGTLTRLGEFRISFQTIYRYVRRDWKQGGSLYEELRRRYKRRKRHYGPERRGKLQGKRMIDERPACVEARQQIGHWELDTVQGSSAERCCIITLVERATGHTLIAKAPNRTADVVARRLIAMVRNAKAPVLTITADNGTEFHGYRTVEAATGATIYFARPYHPWERGTNENTNGLIRQYLPKGQSMARLTQGQCNAIALKLNTRPRKRLDYDTPIKRLQGA
jgi:IS30 family transposase